VQEMSRPERAVRFSISLAVPVSDQTGMSFEALYSSGGIRLHPLGHFASLCCRDRGRTEGSSTANR
jgi:hypothetical protein